MSHSDLIPTDALIVFGSLFLLICHDLEKNFKSGFCSERHEFVVRFRSDYSMGCRHEGLYCLCLRPRLSNRIPADQFLVESFLFPGLAGLYVWVFASPRLASAV